MTLIDTSEKDFESTIEQHLIDSGFIKRISEDHYDKDLCLDTELLFDFIITTQAEKWETLKLHHQDQVKSRFLKRLTQEIESQGTLYVLQNGVIDCGQHFDLAYFKPETRMNPQHQNKYKANRFSVIRQLYYSQKNKNSIDLSIFLNGLPIFTAELKNPLKGQNVSHAMHQYCITRDPAETLLKFKRCLAHFAVDTDLVYMTTQLKKQKTFFLPFNLGDGNGAGNPPADGFKTAYLWEHIWHKDSLLNIIHHFLQLVDELDEDGNPTGRKKLIFPRYHQLDAVRRMVAHAKEYGSGQNYLVEHSAGSGKSNTIAWLGHQLASLHNDDDQRIFDTIIVLTDRRILDRQLRETVKSFEQTTGLVSCIEEHKARDLTEALKTGADIITVTIQSFPFVTEKIAETQGKNFAVLIDEAHSSQSGETARSMKMTLGSVDKPDMPEEPQDDEILQPDDEDKVNQKLQELMDKTGRMPNISFFAFTATPKPKTIELFGTDRGGPKRYPFSLHSMRQAIEEKFILDVLENYTTFEVYFELHKKIQTNPEYSKKKAMSLLKSYVDLHDHNLRKKTEIMIEHFENQVKNRIQGRAKAMVVTKGRLQAVKYRRMFDKVLAEQNLSYKALVAFSGTVKDRDTGKEYTETGMNGFAESKTAAKFKRLESRFLIVAEKFQTGFDEPLLHTMYVDKKLSGVNAVQTLSRLNRNHPSKEDTMVLDFVNQAKHIRDYFQPYFETTILSETTDPNKLYDLKRNVEQFLLYQRQDVENFTKVYFSPKGTQQHIRAVLDPVVVLFNDLEREKQEAFKKAVTDYIRQYAFLSHILRFNDPELEKSYQFLRLLRPLLKIQRERLPRELLDQINMASYKINQTSSGTITLLNADGELKPASDLGTGDQEEVPPVPLSDIIEYINANYGTDFTDEDKVEYFANDMQRRLEDVQALRTALDPQINPSQEQQQLAFGNYFDDVLDDMIDTNVKVYKKIIEDENFGEIFKKIMFQRLLKTITRRTA